jgi:hypothetical protein
VAAALTVGRSTKVEAQEAKGLLGFGEAECVGIYRWFVESTRVSRLKLGLDRVVVWAFVCMWCNFIN